jgi:excisionase family DNA binding protein
MQSAVDRPDPDAFLTPGEVASMFSVTPKTVTRWAEGGKLPCVRTLGGHRRFPAGPVLALHDELLSARSRSA